jgi:hypothetical protein
MLPRIILALATLLMPRLAFTQNQNTLAEAPCSSTEARAFDFWIGSWTVSTPEGKPLGENRIESLLGGCVLLENWRDAAGEEGKSWNYWHASSKSWKQHWIDKAGRVTQYVGASLPTGMRFEASEPGLRRQELDHGIPGHLSQALMLDGFGSETECPGTLQFYPSCCFRDKRLT